MNDTHINLTQPTSHHSFTDCSTTKATKARWPQVEGDISWCCRASFTQNHSSYMYLMMVIECVLSRHLQKRRLQMIHIILVIICSHCDLHVLLCLPHCNRQIIIITPHSTELIPSVWLCVALLWWKRSENWVNLSLVPFCNVWVINVVQHLPPNPVSAYDDTMWRL